MLLGDKHQCTFCTIAFLLWLLVNFASELSESGGCVKLEQLGPGGVVGLRSRMAEVEVRKARPEDSVRAQLVSLKSQSEAKQDAAIKDGCSSGILIETLCFG